MPVIEHTLMHPIKSEKDEGDIYIDEVLGRYCRGFESIIKWGSLRHLGTGSNYLKVKNIK